MCVGCCPQVLLTAYPCLLVLGPSPTALLAAWSSGPATTCPLPATLYLNTVCSLAGAWLGAVPLPLDWDRPWQVGAGQ
jgi:phosphatidylinositol glycan class F